MPAVFGAKYMALYPAAVIVENATFVAPETDAPAAFLIVMNTELVAALVNVSWLIFGVENEWITTRPGGEKPADVIAPRTRPSGPGFIKSISEFDGLVGHEDEHVPNLLRLVFLHRDDDRVRATSAQVVHEDVKELAQDLRIVVDRQAVDRVQHDERAPVRVLAEKELDLQHDVLEHRRTLHDDRVRMALRLGHHDLGDAVHEPDVLHRDLEGLHRVQDALARDRRRHVDDLEVFLRREAVDHALDRIEVLIRLQVKRDGGRDRQGGELLRDLGRDAQLSHLRPRSRLSATAPARRRTS